MYGNRNTILVSYSSVAILLTSIASSINLLIVLMAVNIVRKLSNSSWSSNGIHICLTLDAN